MEVLRFYGAEDYANALTALVRNGYRLNTWAELDHNNNIIYLINFVINTPPVPEVVVEEPKKSKKQVLNEDGNQE